MRLIDADAELKKLDEMEIEGETFVTAVSFAKLVLANAPTVWCNDCKYGERKDGEKHD